MEVKISVICFFSFCLLAESSIKTETSVCNLFPCDKQLPQDDDAAELACCLIDGKRTCCKLGDIMPEVVGNISSFNGPLNQINKGTDVPTETYGVAVTAGIVIAVVLLLVGCGVAFYYCCKMQTSANNGFMAPVVSQRQGQRTVVSVPIGPQSHDSHVQITINNEGVSLIHYNPSKKPSPLLFSDEPPKYEEVNTMSTPAGDSDQPVDSQLPSYQAASSL